MQPDQAVEEIVQVVAGGHLPRAEDEGLVGLADRLAFLGNEARARRPPGRRDSLGIEGLPDGLPRMHARGDRPAGTAQRGEPGAFPLDLIRRSQNLPCEPVRGPHPAGPRAAEATRLSRTETFEVPSSRISNAWVAASSLVSVAYP